MTLKNGTRVKLKLIDKDKKIIKVIKEENNEELLKKINNILDL